MGHVLFYAVLSGQYSISVSFLSFQYTASGRYTIFHLFNDSFRYLLTLPPEFDTNRAWKVRLKLTREYVSAAVSANINGAALYV
ncbi:hypothetical protein D3C77_773100 [compost metagenome]